MFHSLNTVTSYSARYCTFQDRGSVWPSAPRPDSILPDFGALSAGLLTGSMVATNTGWRAVETLQPGDAVLTFEHGLRKLVSRSANPINRDPRSGDAGWGLAVPKGALGNRSAMTLLPSQLVLLECDYGLRHFGDPFILAPAGLLAGYKGIARTPLPDDMQSHILAFEDAEVIHSNGSALLACFATRRTAQRGYPSVTWADAAAFRAELFSPAPPQHTSLSYAPRLPMTKGALV